MKHRWLKVRTHVYRCRRADCRLRKVNVQLSDASPALGGTGGRGGWTVRWTWPDGTVEPGTATPACRGGAVE